MNAIQFIKKFGIDEAKQIISRAPSHANVYDIDNKEYADATEDTFGLSCNLVGLGILKKMVERLDFVQTYGGIVMAKRQLDLFLRVNLEQGTVLSDTVLKLKGAVAVHESIYGADHG
ncbi:hypothetical protein R4467_02010 [Acinetobacter baumannii]|nr:hypothetical protein [Acinetobacter baumannii]